MTTSPKPPSVAAAAPPDPAGPGRPVLGGLPTRNPDFTGRERLLRDLHDGLRARSTAAVLPQTLHGLPGVGKTQLALEYAYRFGDQYDLIWWIGAGQPAAVLAALAALGGWLGVPAEADLRQRAVAVRNALGTRTKPWLLVFDDAGEPADLAPLVPPAGGHVIITSRNQAWAHVWDAIEVGVLDRAESVELVRKRGQRIARDDADRLAERLGDLPLALDQAATWQAATGMPVAEYLSLFDAHAHDLLGEGGPTGYPGTVASCVQAAAARLAGTAPAAAQLLEMLAVLDTEPVPVSLLHRGRDATIAGPLGRVLRQPVDLHRTVRELRRHGLAQLDRERRIQVHRLVRLVLRASLDPARAAAARCHVQHLLTAASPGEPDDPGNWPAHADIGPHLRPAGMIEAESDDGRRVVLDQIRFRYATGDYEGSRALAQAALDAWVSGSGPGLGPDGELTLLASRHLASALRELGDKERARKLDADGYDSLRSHPDFGPNHQHTLAMAGGVGGDLRLAGEYRAALDLDRDNLRRYRQIFGDDHPDTLVARGNLAADLRLLGHFGDALTIDEALVRHCRHGLGDLDPRTLWWVSSLARDRYGLGRYWEALELAREAWPGYRELLGTGHTAVLLAARTIAIALRKTGMYAEAAGQARENYRACHARFGADHEHTLVAAMTCANSLRAVGELAEARALAVDAVARYRTAFGDRHPLTLAATANMAIVLRALGELREARRLDEETLDAMREVLGPDHEHTLCVAANLAGDLALHQETERASELSEQTLRVSRQVRGAEHPYTLACAVNAALDRQATGAEEAGRTLLDETLSTLSRILGPGHPETVDAGRRKRAECDIEPPPG